MFFSLLFVCFFIFLLCSCSLFLRIVSFSFPFPFAVDADKMVEKLNSDAPYLAEPVDVWGVGVILFTLLAGSRSFPSFLLPFIHSFLPLLFLSLPLLFPSPPFPSIPLLTPFPSSLPLIFLFRLFFSSPSLFLLSYPQRNSNTNRETQDTPWDEPTIHSPEFVRYVSGAIFSELPWRRLSEEALCEWLFSLLSSFSFCVLWFSSCVMYLFSVYFNSLCVRFTSLCVRVISLPLCVLRFFFFLCAPPFFHSGVLHSTSLLLCPCVNKTETNGRNSAPPKSTRRGPV